MCVANDINIGIDLNIKIYAMIAKSCRRRTYIEEFRFLRGLSSKKVVDAVKLLDHIYQSHLGKLVGFEIRFRELGLPNDQAGHKEAEDLTCASAIAIQALMALRH